MPACGIAAPPTQLRQAVTPHHLSATGSIHRRQFHPTTSSAGAGPAAAGRANGDPAETSTARLTILIADLERRRLAAVNGRGSLSER